jgi:hypothetical protein
MADSCSTCFYFRPDSTCHWAPALVVPNLGAFWPHVPATEWCGKFCAADPHIYVGNTVGPTGPAGAAAAVSKNTITLSGSSPQTVTDASVTASSVIVMMPTNVYAALFIARVSGGLTGAWYVTCSNGSFTLTFTVTPAGTETFSYAVL